MERQVIATINGKKFKVSDNILSDVVKRIIVSRAIIIHENSMDLRNKMCMFNLPVIGRTGVMVCNPEHILFILTSNDVQYEVAFEVNGDISVVEY